MELKSVKETWDSDKLERLNAVKRNLIQSGWSSGKHLKSVKSAAQMRISGFLNKRQIRHNTEVDLDGVNRPVDIFIPPKYFNDLYQASGRVKQNNFKGVVIEYNGPFHFDSYTKVINNNAFF